METQAHFENHSDESACLPQNKPGKTIQDAIQDYLREGVDTNRVHVGETLGGVFKSLKWPSYEEWLENEKAQRQAKGNN